MSSHIVIEHIEAECTLRDRATKGDLAFVEQFSSASRRCEVLSWRAIVRRELGNGVEISHDEYGAPKVKTPNTIYNISVSHCRDRVAVLFSEDVCAVDIEQIGRDFRKVASRYLSDEEQTIAERYGLYAEMWCAKEALYKYYKKGHLDLVRDVAISEYERGVLYGSILGSAPIAVRVWREGDIAVAVID